MDKVGPDRVLRPMRLEDLEDVLDVQEAGSVKALGHVFDQRTAPFPRAALRSRWTSEIADLGTDCFVIRRSDGMVAGFAASRGHELLHFGTALATWGSGLARRAHDELLTHLRDQEHDLAQLWVFDANRHARHFYEHRGWRRDGRTTTSAFPPHPALLGYERDLTDRS